MSGLSIASVKKEMGGGAPKTIAPGKVRAKILRLELQQPEFLKKDDAYYFVMHLEAEKPNENFEGFFIDPEDESKGKYEGPIGKVKFNSYPYRSATLPNGVEVDRNNQIIKELIRLTEEAGVSEWLLSKDGKVTTIEELIDLINEEQPLKDIYLHFVIGGRGYLNKQSYVAYDLHLPKYNGAKQYSLNENELMVFDKAEMVVEPEKKTLESFDAGDAEAITEDSGSDFDLDNIDGDPFDEDEFEL